MNGTSCTWLISLPLGFVPSPPTPLFPIPVGGPWPLPISQVFAESVYEDALEYPFLSAMLAPFGPDAVQPFDSHLRGLHRDYSHSHGGCWFRMTSPAKSRSKLAQVLETEDGSLDPEGTTEGTNHLPSLMML